MPSRFSAVGGEGRIWHGQRPGNQGIGSFVDCCGRGLEFLDTVTLEAGKAGFGMARWVLYCGRGKERGFVESDEDVGG